MAVITISRGSYSKGKAVAEKVAEKLGYECLSRDVILEASEEFSVPEIKLVRAIHDAPGILERLSHGKNKYVSYIQTALLKHFCNDNVVYHGLAGHYFVQGIPHVLKVRIIADMEERIKLEMEKENITREQALHLIKKDDDERRKWSEYLYDTNTADPSLYDLVIHTTKLSVDDAAEIICHTISMDRFKTTEESIKAMQGLLLAAEVKTAVVGLDPDINVCALEGQVWIKGQARLLQQSSLNEEIKQIALGVKGVREVQIELDSIVPLSE